MLEFQLQNHKWLNLVCFRLLVPAQLGKWHEYYPLVSKLAKSPKWVILPGQSSGAVPLLSFCYVIFCADCPFRNECDSSLQGVRPGQCYSASVNRFPSETSPDRDVVTSPLDMDRNNPIRVRIRARGGKCKIVKDNNRIKCNIFEKCKGCILIPPDILSRKMWRQSPSSGIFWKCWANGYEYSWSVRAGERLTVLTGGARRPRVR